MNTKPFPPLPGRRKSRSLAAFTLIELLSSIALLSFLLLILSAVTESASRAWRDGQSRTDTFQSARTSLEILSRELTPAVVDTRMQFVIAPGSLLTTAGAKNVAPSSSTILWMAPQGQEGDLCCLGYYLYRDTTRNFYRLKRLYIPPTTTSGTTSPYYPKMINLANARDSQLRTSPVDAQWFTRTWNSSAFDEEDPNNKQAVVSAAADGVIAFWIQPRDVLGQPAPLLSKATNHPTSQLYFNSAAFFQMATTAPFDNGKTLLYQAQTAQTMKANRLPAALDLTVVMIDQATLARGFKIPEQVSLYDSNNALDVEASTQAFETSLQKNGIYSARTFSTRVPLTNGS